MARKAKPVTAKKTISKPTASKKPVTKSAASTSKVAASVTTAFPFTTLKGLPTMNASVMGNLEDFQTMGKDNVEAMVQSTKILTKGMEDLTKAFFDLAQTSMEQSVSASQAMMKAKSLKEVTDLQNDLAKKSFDQFVAEGTKLSELSIKVANDAAEPLASRVNDVVSKMNVSA
ncbi:MAG: phasin family protein [Pseudomonadota bacterium]